VGQPSPSFLQQEKNRQVLDWLVAALLAVLH
jgi:hypothetical protein